jgi:excisionase family DNA binding protein
MPADVRPSPPSHADRGASAGEPLQLYTPAAAAALLAVPASWLQRKAAARLIPSTFLGKHLRFSHTDLTAIIAAGQRPAITGHGPSRSRPRRS